MPGQTSVEASGEAIDEHTADEDADCSRLFELQAALRPTALAVAAPDGALTYAEVDARSSRLAEHLRTLGVEAEAPVGICLERSAELVVAVLGVSRSGYAHLAMDPAEPEERLKLMLEDAGSEVLITRRHLASLGERVTTVSVHGTQNGRPGVSRQPRVSSSEGAAAYVIYTSGSSGEPKGVVVEQRGLANLVGWHRDAFAVTSNDRATLIASPGFDASVWELWPYMTSGASLHVPNEAERIDPTRLRDWMVAEQITISFVPTALAEALFELSWPAGTRLRCLLTGGDSLRRRPPDGLPFTVVNNYGLTESTVVTTSGVVPPGLDLDSPPSIGKPISGAITYVVDAALNPVEAGNVGELLIGGDVLARGYIGRHDLTAERFIADPFSARPGARLFRSGDLVRFRPDGQLDFVGRMDDQVQIRGQRVEPGEVAAVLGRHASVRSCVVVPREDQDGHTSLVAYATLAIDAHPAVEVLRADLARHLPEYMIPARFIWLDELPMSANGKVDRAALPPPSTAERSDLPLPEDPLEEALSNMVAEVLGLERVGVDENFFDLGGHSLLGAQLIARISDRIGIEVELRSLFDHPTVAGLARVIEDHLTAADSMKDQ